MRKQYTIPLAKQSLRLGERTLVMGILNVTPDSFSDGGQFYSKRPADAHQLAIERAHKIVAEGADILDIGGESTRPGADPVSVDDEISRVIPVIEALKDQIPIPISIDTYKASVAAAAIDAGAQIVNDISGLNFDRKLAAVVARTGAAVCLMHTRGTPQTMHKLPPSADIWLDIETYLTRSIELATTAGILRERLIIDPGIGFGKTMTDNLVVIAQLSRLEQFDLPILIGTSRKSFIGKLLDRPDADRLMGTAASVSASIMQGAHIVRVHDVASMIEVAQISDAICRYATI